MFPSPESTDLELSGYLIIIITGIIIITSIIIIIIIIIIIVVFYKKETKPTGKHKETRIWGNVRQR